MQLPSVQATVPAKQQESGRRSVTINQRTTEQRTDLSEPQPRFYKLEGPFVDYQSHHRRGLLAYQQQITAPSQKTTLPHHIDQYV